MIVGRAPVHRSACPVCGREMHIPVHHRGDVWTQEQLHWVYKFLKGGVARKQVARLMNVSAAQLAGILKKQSEGTNGSATRGAA